MRLFLGRCALFVSVLIIFTSQSRTGSLSAASRNHLPHGKAIVVGGIDPCEGMIIHGGPRYAAGTVTVLAGHAIWKRMQRRGYRWIFPRRVVAKARLATNARFRFVLHPGQYVLRARYPPPANVYPFVQVTLKPGKVVHADIPNVCM